MNRYLGVGLPLLLVGSLLLTSAPARAQAVPAALRGKIFASSRAIEIPSSARGMLRKLKRQDRVKFKRDAQGHWTINFVAFFRKPLPVEQMGIVVLDPKKEAVAVAEVAGKKGQTSLAAQIVVDSTEAPGKKHLLRVYYASKGKPIVLADKNIVLK